MKNPSENQSVKSVTLILKLLWKHVKSIYIV